MDAVLIAAVSIAMVVGVVGTIFPFVPGLPIVWGAALVYGWVADFGTVGWICFGIITVLFAGGMAAGVILPKKRLESAGAPRSTMAAGLLLGIIGFFVIPVVGLVVGAALGVWLAERGRLGDSSAAWRSTRSLLIGFGTGAVAQLGAGLGMIAVWVVWVIAGG